MTGIVFQQLPGINLCIHPCFIFKLVEFDQFKIRVMQLFPEPEKQNG